jgi:hypothetical protein
MAVAAESSVCVSVGNILIAPVACKSGVSLHMFYWIGSSIVGVCRNPIRCGVQEGPPAGRLRVALPTVVEAASGFT